MWLVSLVTRTQTCEGYVQDFSQHSTSFFKERILFSHIICPSKEFTFPAYLPDMDKKMRHLIVALLYVDRCYEASHTVNI
jgi:hypothetical protein